MSTDVTETAPTDPRAEEILVWGNEHVSLHLALGPDAAPRLLAVTGPAEPAPDLALAARSALPLVEVALAGQGRSGTSGKRHVDTVAGARQRLVAVRTDDGADPRGGRAGAATLVVQTSDGDSLDVTTTFSLEPGSALVRTWSEVVARDDVVLEYVSSLALGGLGAGTDWENLSLWRAPNPWSGEFRWASATLGELGLYDVGMVEHDQTGSKNRITTTSTGAWSTSELLPMGVLDDGRRLLVWQVEHNGAWHYEIADRYDALYLTVSGPTEAEHQWAAPLAAGESFRTVPVSFGVVAGGWDELGAALTRYRRAVRRPHEDHVALPVVYNDFLNALMSDPTTERVLPLLEAAADLGVEVYCMDAGWYDDEAGGWWDSVGLWEPSANRFPDGGLAAVLDRVRERGMSPGLWLEPEVVGRRSPLVDELSDQAFFTRNGHRVLEWGRHQLDLRHPEARAHLDTAVDRLVAQFHLTYLKLDYNVDIGTGTDAGRGEPLGAGLLGHNRAFLDWVGEVMDRHPGVAVEGCAAGGSRTDGASGAVFPLQSLTDQQDWRKMPPIAAAAPTALPPEQSGVWGSVDGSMSDEEIAFSLVTTLLGRVHLAGRIDTLDAHQRELVRDALTTYRGIRQQVARGLPVWPLGLPGWRDDWLASGLRDGEELLLAVWRRGGGATQHLPLPAWLGRSPEVEVLYPTWGASSEVTVVPGGLDVALEVPLGARLLRVTRGSSTT